MIAVDSLVELVHLVTLTKRTIVAGFELHDVKTNAIDKTVTGYAQSATCVFCRKTIVSWKGRPAAKRSPRSNAMLPPQLMTAMDEHTPACAEAWMWELLARWSTGRATPREIKGIHVWGDRYPTMASVFHRLPHPPNSEVAQELEVALIAISRLWS